MGIGLFGLPNIMVFQFLFTLVAPVIDLMLLWSIASGLTTYTMHPEAGLPPTLLTVGAYWAYFQVLEVATSALAISMERRHQLWRLLPLLFLQRFCYRQLLYVTAVRVAGGGAQGAHAGLGQAGAHRACDSGDSGAISRQLAAWPLRRRYSWGRRRTGVSTVAGQSLRSVSVRSERSGSGRSLPRLSSPAGFATSTVLVSDRPKLCAALTGT